MFLILLERLIVLFMIAGLGYFARRKQLISDSGQDTLRTVLLSLSVPFVLLASSNMPGESLPRKDILIMIGISALCLLVFWLVAQLITRIKPMDRSKRAACIFNLMFGNTIFIGLPLADAAFGPKGTFCVAMFNLLSMTLIWTYGVSVASKDGRFSWKRLFLNPGALASIVTLLLVLFELRLPAFALDFCSFMGNMSAPLSMLLLGAMLAGVPLRQMLLDRMASLITLLRLVVIPLVLLLLLRILHVPNFLLQISAICVSMPAGAMNPNIIQNGGLDPAPANAGVVQSTALALVTMPLMVVYAEYLSILPL